jgi:hypothetical protein
LTSRTTARFRAAFDALPEDVKRRARAAFGVWRENPAHPSLRFKQVHATEAIYSVRVGLGWRAIGLREGDAMVWFWIGSHAEYDRLIERL